MKILKTTGILTVLFAVASCQNNSVNQHHQKSIAYAEKKIPKPIDSSNVQEVKLKVEGMTCKLGCAKFIENKLASLEGVVSAKVNFETKIATLAFDNTQQSPESFKNLIEAVADGKTYRASQIQ